MRPFLMSSPSMHEALQPRSDASRAPLTEIVKDTATDLVTLVTAEVKLARLELLAGARNAISRAAWIAIGAVPLLTAYLLGVGALAVWLHTLWGWAGGLAATAVAQAIIGTSTRSTRCVAQTAIDTHARRWTTTITAAATTASPSAMSFALCKRSRREHQHQY